MRYKYSNVISMTALALLMTLSWPTNQALAQGVVTLSEDAVKEDEALNKDIPDELSLFDDSGLDELGLPASPNNDLALQPVKSPDALIANGEKPMFPAGTDNVSAAADEEKMRAAAETQLLPRAALPGPAANLNTAPDDDLGLDALLAEPGAGIGALGSNEAAVIDDEVFAKMSDLEKQTALLNLELRRERVKNEIEAIKNQRKLAIEQEKDKAEAKRKAQVEWEKAQEQKVLQEQQKLRELDIEFEKIRQEKLLNSYKNKMLQDHQKWIEHNGEMYEQIKNVNEERNRLAEDSKGKLSALKNAVISATNVAIEAKAAYQREIADLQTQISILKARIDAQEKEMEKQNPFADGAAEGQAAQLAASVDSEEREARLTDMYAVMEIRGQGGELIAKLINQEGMPFYVKKGTTLQSGHVVDEITSTYVRADRNGSKDYLYFAAGGILPLEPNKSEVGVAKEAPELTEEDLPPRELNSSDGVPGLGRDMMAR